MSPPPEPDLAALLLTRSAPDIAKLSVAAMARSVEGTLRMARSLAEAGRTLDLAGLDGLVGQLTARTLDLPPEDGRTLRPALQSILTELDGLETLLHQHTDPAPPD